MKLTEDQEQWIREQEAIFDEGQDIVKRSSDEAVDYIADAVENIGDIEWRKMAYGTQSLETGIGAALADHLVPKIYNDMLKGFQKKLKLSKKTSLALRHIYIGRVIKNVGKEREKRERDQQKSK